MNKIYKYPLMTDMDRPWHYEAYMPMIARILKCGFQNNTPFVWALVDDGTDEVVIGERIIPFLILPTGHDVDDTAHHLETVFNGDLVWHFFVVEGSHGVSAHP